MNKKVKAIIIVAFFAVCMLFLAYIVATVILPENTYPVITADSLLITVSVRDGEDVLMRGVSAFDAEDGDLTSEIILEKVSKFYEDGKCVATYAVVDSDNNVTKANRTIYFSDYVSPAFTLTNALIFDYGTTMDILGPVGASDCLDGNISSSVRIALQGGDEAITGAGVYSVRLSVTNSYGDTAELLLPVRVLSRTTAEIRYQPVIKLNSYIIYADKDSAFNPARYIDGLSINSEDMDFNEELRNKISISSNVDTSSAGIYEVKYEYTTDNGYTGYTYLTVIVKE